MTSEISTARHMGLFLELWLALGGKAGKAAVLTPFMRMHKASADLEYDVILIFFVKSMGWRYIRWT